MPDFSLSIMCAVFPAYYVAALLWKNKEIMKRLCQYVSIIHL